MEKKVIVGFLALWGFVLIAAATMAAAVWLAAFIGALLVGYGGGDIC